MPVLVHTGSVQKNISKFTNFSQTFSHCESQLQKPSMMPKYGMEKQHEGTQLFHTSSKGAQPLLYPMAKALYQSKLIGRAFFVILHDYFFNRFFNYCSVLGNAVSE